MHPPRPRCLAIIPARGGSKGLPGKNIRPVAGRPLIAWTIGAAHECRSLERIVVSTDDAEIAAVARGCGGEVPFLRPAELAEDHTTLFPVVRHVLDRLKSGDGYEPDLVLCLQPTSPLRTSEDIAAAIALLVDREADSLVSVTEAHPHPAWTKRLDESGWVRDYIPGTGGIYRRQDLPAAYGLNGAIYLARRDVLLGQDSWYTDRTCAYVMPQERSIDVDSAWELRLVDWLLRERQHHTS